MNGVALYTAVQNAASADELVRRHLALVKRIAYHLVSRLPSSVQVDDLIQAGLIGLMEASGHYDSGQGATFETYAGIRIRGAMLDEIRRYDWAPRSVHRKARAVAKAMQQVEQQHGRDAGDREVAEAMGVSLAEYHQIVQDASVCRLFSLDGDDGNRIGESVADDRDSPLQALEDEDARRLLATAIEGLPERERLVLSLYYDQELNLREIGAVLGVSESRVCQIHGQALLRVRGKLGDSDAA
jgi:RNA polymerase sigma factor for flagellar operon FliA